MPANPVRFPKGTSPCPAGRRRRPASALAVAVLGLLAGLSFAAAGCDTPSGDGGKASGWLDYSSPDRDYHVLLPDLPSEQGERVAYKDPKRGLTFSVVSQALTPSGEPPAVPPVDFDATRDNIVKNFPEGKLVAEKAVQLGKHRGREIDVEGKRDGAAARKLVRVYQVGAQVYVLAAEGPKTSKDFAARAARFLDSFRLTGVAPPAPKPESQEEELRWPDEEPRAATSPASRGGSVRSGGSAAGTGTCRYSLSNARATKVGAGKYELTVNYTSFGGGKGKGESPVMVMRTDAGSVKTAWVSFLGKSGTLRSMIPFNFSELSGSVSLTLEVNHSPVSNTVQVYLPR